MMEKGFRARLMRAFKKHHLRLTEDDDIVKSAIQALLKEIDAIWKESGQSAQEASRGCFPVVAIGLGMLPGGQPDERGHLPWS